jgi:hypothetical protein
VINPTALFRGLGNWDSAHCTYDIHRSPRAYDISEEQACRYQPAAADSLTAMYQLILTAHEVVVDGLPGCRHFGVRTRYSTIGDWKPYERHALRSRCASFTAEIEILFLVGSQQR